MQAHQHSLTQGEFPGCINIRKFIARNYFFFVHSKVVFEISFQISLMTDKFVLPTDCEAVWEWKDEQTDAIGWVVWHTITNGVSGGGIFMSPTATPQEVADIARNMTKKFTVTDPMIGGAKAGIRFDFLDPRAKEVLRRFILAHKQHLSQVWVTGGDLNVDDQWVEHCVQEAGLTTCQATLGRKVAQATKQKDLSTQLRDLLPFPACEFFPLIEGTVGYGVASAVEWSLQHMESKKMPRVLIQGFGAVGSSLAYYLHVKKLAHVVGIADKDGFVFGENLDVIQFLKLREAAKAQVVKDKESSLFMEHAKNLLINLPEVGDWKVCKRSGSNEEFLDQFLRCTEADVFCPCAGRYCITPKIAHTLAENHFRLVVSGANNPFSSGGADDTDGIVLAYLQSHSICVVPDYVANSGTAQLFHRGLSVDFHLEDKNENLPGRVLEACAEPIRSFLDRAWSLVTQGIPSWQHFMHLNKLPEGCAALTQEKLTHPTPFQSKQLTKPPVTQGEKVHPRSRYALPAPLHPSSLSLEEKLEKIVAIAPPGECIEIEELRRLLETCTNPVTYDGFEPSGRMHVAQALLKRRYVDTLTDAGFTFVFWVADWFAYLNGKMGGNLSQIQTLGHYFIEVWKACGMNMDRVKFVWASEEIKSHPEEYFKHLLRVATRSSLNSVKKCCTIMGKKDERNLKSSDILYALMQATDVFFLGVDATQLGLDQRKVNMHVRDVADEKTDAKPIVISHRMMPGLLKGQEKMSKSDPDNALFMEDSKEDLSRKIKKAYCPPNEVKDNPLFEYFRHILFPLCKDGIRVGDRTFTECKGLEESYIQGTVSPQDLKEAFIYHLDSLIAPVRCHFATDPSAKALLAQVKDITAKK
jgi:tyrosyl-tRNA synthetase